MARIEIPARPRRTATDAAHAVDAAPAPEPSAATDGLSRRTLLQLTAAGGTGLVLGLHLPGSLPAAAAADAAEPAASTFTPNVWIRIAPDGAVVLTVAKSELGQGVWTALPMIVAEELEADWSRVSIEQAPLGKGREYGDPNTGGSSSVSDSFDPLRRAGAVAREMLIQAAAQRWAVEAPSCRAEKGSVLHSASGRKLGYGELAVEAGKLPVPDAKTVKLKDPKDFHLIGTRAPRQDVPAKLDGRQRYGCDVRLPGMLYATIERCPIFGGKMGHLDDGAARRTPGVTHVVELTAFDPPSHVRAGVAVVGATTWAALQGRRALNVTWDEGEHGKLDSAAIGKALRAATSPTAGDPQPYVIESKKEGDVHAALAGAGAQGAKTVDIELEVPFLAHATMEPMNSTAVVTPEGCEIWAPTQYPRWVRDVVSEQLKLEPEAVKVNVTFSGGGFGRRINPDYALEAALLAKVAGKPVQLLWTREDDMRHDFYRPASRHRLRAALDKSGRITAWWHRLAGPSTAMYYIAPRDRAERQEVWGAEEIPYAAGSFLLDYALVELPVPLGWWRSVAHSQNVFCIEAFVDALAAAAGQDPLAWRLAQAKSPRLKKVLETVRDAAGWGKPLPAGRGRGIAATAYGKTFVAQVVEVTVDGAGAVKVDRVVCAFDCGQMIHPGIVEAQIEGSIVWGLSAALYGEITIERGRTKQSNFHDYPVLRMGEMPKVEIHLIASQEPPSGVGEPAVPPVAPALVNAVFAATGKRVRRLPLRG
jgi:isoquinoline 1-oxidoreductase beta subunit